MPVIITMMAPPLLNVQANEVVTATFLPPSTTSLRALVVRHGAAFGALADVTDFDVLNLACDGQLSLLGASGVPFWAFQHALADAGVIARSGTECVVSLRFPRDYNELRVALQGFQLQ